MADNPKQIDWQKVAKKLRELAAVNGSALESAAEYRKPAIATVMATCNCLAAAIEDGLS